VDYIAWTGTLARFARRSDLRSTPHALWVSGHVSPRTRRELERLGWTVNERVLGEALAAGQR
jgi:hypothetical protein